MELWFWLPQVEIVLDAVMDAVLLLLVQLWFSVCSMEKEESRAWVRSLFAQAGRGLSRLTGRERESRSRDALPIEILTH